MAMETADMVKLCILLLGVLTLAHGRVHRGAAFAPKHNRLKNETSYHDKVENEVIMGEVEADILENMNGGLDDDEGWEEEESLPIMQQKMEPTEEILNMLEVMAEDIAGLRGQLSTLKFQNHLIYKQLKKTPYKCSMPIHPVIKSGR